MLSGFRKNWMFALGGGLVAHGVMMLGSPFVFYPRPLAVIPVALGLWLAIHAARRSADC